MDQNQPSDQEKNKLADETLEKLKSDYLLVTPKRIKPGCIASESCNCYKTWYNRNMYNWSTDATAMGKDERTQAIWKLEQLINFGLNGEMIHEDDLKRYWSDIQIDPARRRFLDVLTQ